MTEFETLERMSEIGEGILTAKAAKQAGVSRAALYRFIEEKGYERMARGIYLSPDGWPDEEYVLQLRCPGLIFSHETALYLHELSDRIPFQMTVMARAGYNPSALKAQGIKVYTIREELLELGVTEKMSAWGHPLRLYDPERAMCDILRSRRSLDPQIFFDALKQYARSPDRNVPRLLEYAAAMGVKKLARHYMEVLL